MNPVYEPTDEDRALVENAAAFGVSRQRMAYRLGIDEKTLRKHFRAELDGGMFKAHMQVGKCIYAMATQSSDEKVRADMSKFYARTQMGWKETSVNKQVGKDGGPIEVKDVSANDIIRARISGASSRLGTGSDSGEPE
jgi:hypothetical protein